VNICVRDKRQTKLGHCATPEDPGPDSAFRIWITERVTRYRKTYFVPHQRGISEILIRHYLQASPSPLSSLAATCVEMLTKSPSSIVGIINGNPSPHSCGLAHKITPRWFPRHALYIFHLCHDSKIISNAGNQSLLNEHHCYRI
jgi:hypothetical protein